MKKMKGKTLLTVLAGAVTASIAVTGCSSSPKTSSSPAPTASAQTAATGKPASDMPDTSKPLVLKGYTIAGSVPPLWEEVQKEVNKILSQKINTTIEMTIIPTGDAKTKLPMVNASGEQYDFMFVANWLANYAPEVSKGAYEEITEEKLQKLMPRYSKAVDKANLEAMKVNGKLYSIPATTAAVNPTGIAIRKDLREKYGLGPIKSNADLEAYMQAVAKNEKGMIPYNLSKVEATTGLFDLFFTEYFGDFMLSAPGMVSIQSAYEDETGKVYSQLDQKYNEAFKKTAVKMKELYDKGYFPKNPFGNEIRSGESQIQGKSAVARLNLTDFAVNYVKAKGNNFELEYYPLESAKGRVLKPVAGQGVAIKAGNKNLDRVLMALDYIYEEPAIVEMLEYGLEGKSFVVNAEGKIDFPQGVNAANSPYSQGAVAFWFSDNAFKKPMASWPQQKIDVEKEYATRAVSPVLNSLSLNVDKIKTEIASVRGIEDLEGNSLRVGMVDNVDTMMDTYLKKLKSAGYEKIVTEVKAQAEAFLKK
ncbi:DUF3502 domain-containing protein [Paenibacillus sp. YN15]|uniref:DUF3502 domain-containing protein n=1 Tax=Paenibacillus sp. YN15 TaxID=1742774 RepID=UPI000DCE2466|nr:DUF3502 domain-containing protein [Paenibacillus sp. YN15]RAU98097.1 hypothetical protein DQG13_17545 [Paenibacillus sp. YN15]